MNSIIPPVMVFCSKDSFGIKQPTKVDMSLKGETKLIFIWYKYILTNSSKQAIFLNLRDLNSEFSFS